jgi:hypothetical protein
MYHPSLLPQPPLLSFPLLSSVRSLRCTSLDLSGHGDTERVVRPHGVDTMLGVEWRDFGLDVLSVHDELFVRSSSSSKSNPHRPLRPDIVMGVGVSLGGTAMAFAQHIRPVFDHVVLIEPILMGNLRRKVGTLLGEKARSRREVRTEQAIKMSLIYFFQSFASSQEAREYYQTKALFRTWDSRAFEEYIHHGLFRNAHGKVIFCFSLNTF